MHALLNAYGDVTYGDFIRTTNGTKIARYKFLLRLRPNKTLRRTLHITDLPWTYDVTMPFDIVLTVTSADTQVDDAGLVLLQGDQSAQKGCLRRAATPPISTGVSRDKWEGGIGTCWVNRPVWSGKLLHHRSGMTTHEKLTEQLLHELQEKNHSRTGCVSGTRRCIHRWYKDITSKKLTFLLVHRWTSMPLRTSPKITSPRPPKISPPRRGDHKSSASKSRGSCSGRWCWPEWWCW